MRILRFRTGRRAAIKLAVHATSLLVVGAGGDAMANPGKRHLHPRHSVSHVHRAAAVNAPDLAWRQPGRFGVMRYYGGPKSPMWRAPVEN